MDERLRAQARQGLRGDDETRARGLANARRTGLLPLERLVAAAYAGDPAARAVLASERDVCSCTNRGKAHEPACELARGGGRGEPIRIPAPLWKWIRVAAQAALASAPPPVTGMIVWNQLDPRQRAALYAGQEGPDGCRVLAARAIVELDLGAVLRRRRSATRSGRRSSPGLSTRPHRSRSRQILSRLRGPETSCAPGASARSFSSRCSRAGWASGPRP